MTDAKPPPSALIEKLDALQTAAVAATARANAAQAAFGEAEAELHAAIDAERVAGDAYEALVATIPRAPYRFLTLKP